MTIKLGKGFIALSIIGVGASFLWWMRFYSDIMYAFTGQPGPLPVECLYERSGACRIISDVVTWIGYRAYDPMLFWLSIAGFVVGTLLVVIGRIAEPYRPAPIYRREPYV